MSLKLAKIFIMITIFMAGPVFAQTEREVKSDTLKYLQDLRAQNVRRLQEIDKTLSEKIEDPKPAQLDAEVTVLRSAKNEHLLRQEFLNRMIFQVDTKFGGGDLKGFFERALTDMAKVDALSTAKDTGLWKFLKYAADAMRTLPEQKENILSFLEGYMNRSITNPIRPEDFLSTRNYTNGTKSEAAQPISREEVGAIADRRLREQTPEGYESGVTPNPAVPVDTQN
ncbi:MAG: hypothetical protein AB7F86_01095 [Bdellovibrionales bacterium]